MKQRLTRATSQSRNQPERSTESGIFLLTAVDRNQSGGVANVVLQLASALSQGTLPVKVLWIRPPGQATAPDELPGPPAAASGVRARITYAMDSAAFLIRLVLWLRRVRPEIINLHFVHVRIAQVLVWLRPAFGYRLVLSAHGSDIFQASRAEGRWLRRTLSRADAVVAVTQPLAHAIAELLDARADHLMTIPNGIDHAFWSAHPSVKKPASPLVVTVGQLRHVKGHDLLIAAWPAVLASVSNARLQIIGDGPARKELERLAADLEVAPTVEFAGQLRPADVRDALHRATAFCLPSRSEAMPLALLEAMAAGVPSVATRVGGVPQVLQARSGLVVEPDNPEALAAAIIRLLQDRSLADRLGRAAQERARRYAFASTAEQYQSLFDKLRSTNTGP